MGHKLTTIQLSEVLAQLRDKYRIYAPKSSKSGVRYGEVALAEEIVFDQKSDFSPKEVVSPIVQTMLYFTDSACTESEVDDKGIVLFLRPCDVHALEKLDTIFLQNGDQAELYYARMREKVKLFLMECPTGWEDCFCVSMGTNKTNNYSVALRPEAGGFLVQVQDDTFAPLFTGFPTQEFALEFVSKNAKTVTVPNITPEQLPAIHASEIWADSTGDCIACGTCNTVCGSCSCFETIDVTYTETSKSGERRRIWAGCMQEKFAVMAGGHSVRKTPAERMRFKVLHKVYDFNARFGAGHMCVGCGRCDARCPKKISYSHAVNRLSDELKGGAR